MTRAIAGGRHDRRVHFRQCHVLQPTLRLPRRVRLRLGRMAAAALVTLARRQRPAGGGCRFDGDPKRARHDLRPRGQPGGGALPRRNVLAPATPWPAPTWPWPAIMRSSRWTKWIETMDRVGNRLPMELRCTALGGLSILRHQGHREETIFDNLPGLTFIGAYLTDQA